LRDQLDFIILITFLKQFNPLLYSNCAYTFDTYFFFIENQVYFL